MRRQSGFTIVEMVMVALVAGLIIAVAVPTYSRYILKSRVVEATVEIGEMSAKIRAYELANGALPAMLADAGYLGKTDPWGFAYEYKNLVTASGNGQARKDKKLAPLNSDFDLYSVGADGMTHASLGNNASRDDIVRARDGKFIGLAEEFDP